MSWGSKLPSSAPKSTEKTPIPKVVRPQNGSRFSVTVSDTGNYLQSVYFSHSLVEFCTLSLRLFVERRKTEMSYEFERKKAPWRKKEGPYFFPVRLATLRRSVEAGTLRRSVANQPLYERAFVSADTFAGPWAITSVTAARTSSI